MSFSAQACLDLARTSLNDSAKVRYPDPELLSHLNAGLGTFALVRPDLFAVQEPALATTAGQAAQDVASIDAICVLDIYAVTGGDAVTECDLETLSRTLPGWMRAAPGKPIHWMRHPGDPSKRDASKYFLYPPPLSGVTLIAQVAYSPDDVALGGTVPLPGAYLAALAAYVVYCAESKDDEHVLSARAQQSLGFAEKVLGVSLQSKVVVKEGRPA